MRNLICRTTCVAALCLFATSPAHALTLVKQDALQLSFNGLGRGGIQTSVAQGEGGTEAYLHCALLNAKVSYKGVGGLLVQYNFAKGKVQLLDAVATWTPTKFLKFKAGLTKTPVSLEFLESASNLRFYGRAKLTKVVPLRSTGLNGTMAFKLNGVTLGIDLGGWMGSGTDLSMGVDSGMMLTARAMAKLPNGLTFHAAVADHFFSSRAVMQDVNTHQEAVLDLAAKYLSGGWMALSEAAVVLSEQEGPRNYSLYSMVARQFELDAGPVVEPAVSYDQLRTSGETGHYGTVAFNVYWMGNKLMTGADYQVGYKSDDVSHAGYARVQVAF